jgi:SAM-dependent methyltransferase
MSMTTDKPILDPCCGGRMFYWNKHDPSVLYCDNREFDGTIWASRDGTQTRSFTVAPDVIADVTALPFPDETFFHVVLDPPHLFHAGDNAWMTKRYGKLPKDWGAFIRAAFSECWRVLKPNGTLVFKWSECNISAAEVIKAINRKPLYGQRASKTSHWMVYVKS